MQRLDDLLYKCVDGSSDSLKAPLSPFLTHLWYRHEMQHRFQIDDPHDRADFVYWYLHSWHRQRAPYRIPLPDDLIDWLNTPVLDLSSEIKTRPAVEGERKCRENKYLSRLMLYVWRHHNRTLDIFDVNQFYEFLVWFSTDLSHVWNLSPVLVPEDIVRLLNKPAADFSLPLSTGMLVNGRVKYSQQFKDIYSQTREAVIQRSFESIPDLLRNNNYRLLPSYVTRFWTDYAFPDAPVLTTFEYVAACLNRRESGISARFSGKPAEQTDIRQWFTSEYPATLPLSRLFRGSGAGGDPPAPTFSPPTGPVDRSIFIYRDRGTVSGLSRAGYAAQEAFSRSGVKTFEIDFALPRNRMKEEASFNDKGLCSTKRGLHFLNMNPEYVPECMSIHQNKLRANDYVIGSFYWELSEISAVHETGVGLVDEIWVASDYLRTVYEKHTDKPVMNMGQAVVPPVISGTFSRRTFGLPESGYMFLFSFDGESVIERKNPLGVVNAFREAFPKGDEKAFLVLKTRNIRRGFGENDRRHWDAVVSEADRDSRIYLIDGTMSDQELAGLKNCCDCYISLHRSEGFGFGPAEAMSLGKPVIVTNYSGVCDFCNPGNSLLVDYKLEILEKGGYPHTDANRTYYWSSPDIVGASRYMRQMYDSPETGRELGRNGRATIVAQYSVAALWSRYQARLIDLGFLDS